MPIKKFSYQKINLPDDYEGEVEATFIQSNDNIAGQTPILYLHGFVDYFFHPHLAEEFHKHGYNFYAIELRKYGHSLLPHQHPNYCKTLDEYFEEIDIAIEKIYALDKKKVVFFGHSTGGLIASLYADYGKRKELLKALILNSPFLEINAPSIVRQLSSPIMKLAVKVNNYANFPNALSPLYPQSLHKDYKGEWDFNLAYKPIKGFPAYFQWLLAIKEGHDKIKVGLNNQLPILLLHSSSSFLPSKWTDDIHTADIVLNVEHMKKYANNLGENCTVIEVPKARHDIFLSNKKVRDYAYNEVFNWLDQLS
jgi:alpha-beta hydrolase superfamily lysophospholipase